MALKESSPAVRFAASSVKASKFGFDIKQALLMVDQIPPGPLPSKP
jgi:hypothetical protein